MGKARFIKGGAVVSQREFEKPDPDPASHCTKKQYATKEAAKAGLKQVQSRPKRGPDDVRPVAVYKCRKNPGCGQWHLTKQQGEQRMTDRFRVHITVGTEYVYIIDADSAHEAEEIAEHALSFKTNPEQLVDREVHEGAHREVTSVRIPKEKT